MDTVHVNRLREELEYITKNRHKWEQFDWLENVPAEGPKGVQSAEEAACKTTGCLAGNACLRNGRVRFVEGYRYDYILDRDLVFWEALPVDENGEESVWWAEGAKLFGLNAFDADVLFDGGNSLYRLWWLANQFSDGRIEIPQSVFDERDEEDEWMDDDDTCSCASCREYS